jgi:hypothetical protein
MQPTGVDPLTILISVPGMLQITRHGQAQLNLCSEMLTILPLIPAFSLREREMPVDSISERLFRESAHFK